MPYKPQSESYRNIKGERWACLCDIISDDDRDAADAAKRMGFRQRRFVMPDDGVTRVFVRETDLQSILKKLPSDEI